MRKVLFVTNDLLAGLSASFLDRRGVRVRTADDEDSAREVCDAWHPDAVVLPAALVPLGQTLRQGLPNLRVVAVGEMTEDTEVDACLPAGASVDELLEQLGSVLGMLLRRSTRVDVDLIARVKPGGAAEHLAHVIRLSDSGLLLESETELAQGVQVAVELHLPGHDEPVAPRGIVVSSDPAEQRYGVAFSDIEPSHREAIAVYVELQTAARAESTRPTEDKE